MDIRPIRNDADHHAALQEIERLWDFPDDSPENDKLDVLATLVEAYEKARWPIDRATPRDMLEYAVTEMGYSQTELADILGSRSLASELLAGKKRISLDAARKISAAWKMPIQLLVVEDPSLPNRATFGKLPIPKSESAAIRGVEGLLNAGLHLDKAVLEAFRETGPGWEIRINEVLGAASKKLLRKKRVEKRAS